MGSLSFSLLHRKKSRKEILKNTTIDTMQYNTKGMKWPRSRGTAIITSFYSTSLLRSRGEMKKPSPLSKRALFNTTSRAILHLQEAYCSPSQW